MIIKKLLKKAKTDAILISSMDYTKTNPNMVYYSGYKGVGLYLITKKDNLLIVPKMEEKRAIKESKSKVIPWESPYKTIKEEVKAREIKKIGVEEGFSFRLFDKIKSISKFVDISKECKSIRKIKNDKEISLLKRSCKICDRIFSELISDFNFKKEQEINDYIIKKTIEYGCETSFKPIVASGKKASLIHGTTLGKLNNGFCVIDFGVRYKGYCSDMTRTLFLGSPSEKDKKIYEKIRFLQEELVKKAKPGVKCSKLATFASNILGNNMPHSLGHGLGLEVHEFPNINTKSDEMLVKGMCFTIEPGYYDNKIGIRIEDSLAITKKGSSILTKSPKELIVKKI